MTILVSASAIAAASVAPTAAAPMEADAIFAAIERCRVAEAAGAIEPRTAAADDIRPARAALARTVPTTPAGFAALTSFVAAQSRELQEFYFEADEAEGAPYWRSDAMHFAETLNKAVRGMTGQAPWAAYSPPIAVSKDDPIFAAIEDHRASYVAWLIKAAATNELHDDTPEHESARREEDAAMETRADAEFALVDVQPTTIGGVLALLDYMEDYCVGKVAHPEDPKNWCSMVEFLDAYVDDDIVSQFNGQPIELPYLFWITRNVREALASLSN